MSKPVKKGYWNLSNAILDEADLKKTETEKNILTALANLRNSLHNNGMHRNDKLNISLY